LQAWVWTAASVCIGSECPQWAVKKAPTFNLPNKEFIAELKRLNGTPQEVLDNPELMELFMNVG
jgi:medium-chain acyl-[acyl-carrier-protein] hydrolase